MTSCLQADMADDASALIATLQDCMQRLETLTGGEVDSIADGKGGSFLLTRAQEQVRLHEGAKQDAILNALPAHIALLDAAGVIVSVNEAWRTFGGAHQLHSPGHAVGLDYVAVCEGTRGTGSAEAAQVAHGIRSILSGDETHFSIEYPCDSPEQRRWFLMQVTPVAGNRLHGAVVMHVDITAKRLFEESLRSSELRFRQMAENIRDVFFLVDAKDGRMLYMSPAYESIAGRTCQGVYDDPAAWLASMHPADRDAAAAAAATGMLLGKEYEYEARFVAEHGAMRWMAVRGFPVHDGDGVFVRMAGVAEDITDRKDAERDVRLAQERLDIVISSAMDAIVMADEEGRMVMCNPAAQRMFGYTAQELQSLPLERLMPERFRTGHRAHVARVAKEGSAGGREGAMRCVLALRRDGSEFPVEASLSEDMSTGKRIFTAILRDVTERKRAEAELEKSHAELVRASHRAGMAEVATNVLHNVGNVLNSVNVSAGLAAEMVQESRAAVMGKAAALLREHAADLGAYVGSDPQGRHLPDLIGELAAEWAQQQRALSEELRSMRQNIDHIKQIVAMQQDSAKLGGVAELVDPCGLVEDSVRIVGAEAEDGVRIVREFTAVAPFMVQKHKLLQILVNLVRNAQQACSGPNPVPPCITLAISESRGRVSIRVADTGVGIAADNLSRIFSHGFTTRKDGHGFGLHGSALDAAELGGTLAATSRGPGQGATFTLELPATRAHATDE